MPQQTYYEGDNRYINTGSLGFTCTVVKLIDGYIGQVMWGQDIIHQTELQVDAEAASKAAQGATLAAMRKLFA